MKQPETMKEMVLDLQLAKRCIVSDNNSPPTQSTPSDILQFLPSKIHIFLSLGFYFCKNIITSASCHKETCRLLKPNL